MFSFGKGTIEIQIPKYDYAHGETIQGTVILKLKKPIKAKGLFLEFYGERKVSRFAGKRHTTRTMKVFDFKQPLDEEKEYSTTEQTYRFSIKIPKDIVGQSSQEGVAGTLMRATQLLTQTMQSNTRWYLTAYLDIPWAFDVSKKIQITIA